MSAQSKTALALSALTLALAGCGDHRPADDAGSDGSGSGNEAGTAEDGTPEPVCDVVEHALADENAETPWGKTGAELLSEIPEELSTTLDWTLSKSGVSIEIPGRSGNSTGLSATFDISSPRFFWLEATDLDPSDLETCKSVIGVEFAFSMSTSDGTIGAEGESLTESPRVFERGVYVSTASTAAVDCV